MRVQSIQDRPYLDETMDDDVVLAGDGPEVEAVSETNPSDDANSGKNGESDGEPSDDSPPTEAPRPQPIPEPCC